ncbi:MAG: Rieske (2Fe-2S) protein [Polyangiaceae bacterium]|nr:Rieske (2Fe-2S) protein [Polyangiaceae bacterium]
MQRLGRHAADTTTFDAARLASYPPPFPSGWYKVADSAELKAGGVLRVECAGEHLALFRDGDGQVCALEARCPHLGADLSAGVVKDGCLQCPFHHWRFRGDGSVSHIPYQERIPSVLRARSWLVRERWGLVFVYHAHLAEDRAKPPLYELPALEEISSGRYAFRGRHEFGDLRMHLLEFPENGPDSAHFNPLHSKMTIPWTQVRMPFVDIDHQARWDTDPHEAHVAHFDNHATLKIFGKLVPRSSATARMTFIGPGGLGVLRIQLPQVGEVLILETHTPTAPLTVRVGLRWFAERSVPRLLVSYVVGNWVSQLTADLRIWERKSYNPRPMVVENDGPVHKLRQWYRQFYEPRPAE